MAPQQRPQSPRFGHSRGRRGPGCAGGGTPHRHASRGGAGGDCHGAAESGCSGAGGSAPSSCTRASAGAPWTRGQQPWWPGQRQAPRASGSAVTRSSSLLDPPWGQIPVPMGPPPPRSPIPGWRWAQPHAGTPGTPQKGADEPGSLWKCFSGEPPGGPRQSGGGRPPSAVAVGAVGVHGGRVLAARLSPQLPQEVAEVLHLAGAQHAAHPQQLRVVQAAPGVPTAPPRNGVPGGELRAVPGGWPGSVPRDERSAPGATRRLRWGWGLRPRGVSAEWERCRALPGRL